MRPILKWAGGKRQLLHVISMYLNKETVGDGKYFEPFFGGGCVYFNLAPNQAVINDFNDEIINVYKVLKENPTQLIKLLKEHERNNSKEYFYRIRALDRDPSFFKLKKYDDVFKAARTIYLNKTCFNGLYRVNSKGQFNVPYANYAKPLICDSDNILEVSDFLNKSDTQILSGDFEKAVESASSGDFIYFDPPYDYEQEDGFVNYVKEGFTHNDLLRLKKVCDYLIERGCKVLISNNDTTFVRKTFKGDNFKIVYVTKEINANRSINCKGNRRRNAKEVLIYGKRKEE